MGCSESINCVNSFNFSNNYVFCNHSLKTCRFCLKKQKSCSLLNHCCGCGEEKITPEHRCKCSCCGVVCDLNQNHCCDCGAVYGKNLSHCCGCGLTYGKNLFHCCGCKKNFSTGYFNEYNFDKKSPYHNRNHCCGCGKIYGANESHCCGCGKIYDADESHCCNCKKEYRSSKDHCCECEKLFPLKKAHIDCPVFGELYRETRCCGFYYPNVTEHCCDCKRTYSYTKRHCCKCKKEYSNDQKHCCKCGEMNSNLEHCKECHTSFCKWTEYTSLRQCGFCGIMFSTYANLQKHRSGYGCLEKKYPKTCKCSNITGVDIAKLLRDSKEKELEEIERLKDAERQRSDEIKFLKEQIELLKGRKKDSFDGSVVLMPGGRPFGSNENF